MSPIPPVSINAAFRSSTKNEAYIFINKHYVLVDYAPTTSRDRILKGPLLISNGFPLLKDTPFGEHGIDCAFDTDRNEAYIFSGTLSAYIDYTPGANKILNDPVPITDMFPCLRGTPFEEGIDAAFRSSRSNNAYIFRGGQYGRIDYASMTVHIDTINGGWSSLAGTAFENGVDAAFASHVRDQAYVFKGDQYAVIRYNPETRGGDNMIKGPRSISYDWPAVGGLITRMNGTTRQNA